MKRTTIKYRLTQDNQIIIIAIENAAKLSEIKEIYGAEVARVYFDAGIPVWYKYIDGYIPGVYIGEPSGFCSLLVGSIYSRQFFSKQIQKMKAAGSRLQSIVKAEKENRIRTVKI
jgi:hypothetical protein